jgi:sigma-B regulation protein RsbU (phosphoserine phosphatase)
MTIRRRLLLSAVLGCVVVAVAGLAIADQRVRVLEQEIQAAALRRAVLGWDATLSRHVAELQRSLVEEARIDQRFPAAPAEMRDRLAAAEERLRRRGATVLQVLPAQQAAALVTPGSATAAPLLDAALVGELLSLRRPLSGLVRHDGQLLLTVALPAPGAGERTTAILVVARPATDLLPALRSQTGLMFAVTDADGQYLSEPSVPQAWTATLSSLIPEANRRHLVAIGDRVLAVLDLPLTDLAGNRIGFRRWIADETDLQFRKDMGRLIGVVLILALLIGVLLALALWSRVAFRGLESALQGLQALARGDTTVQIENAGKRDEVGAAAQALRVFRQSQIKLQSGTSRAERRRRHQTRFIEAQLGRLSAILGPTEREAMQDEIHRASQLSVTAGVREDALDCLAIALRVMVDRVTAQQEALQGALAEQDAALRARERMQELEQEMSVVAQMQARLTPAALPGARRVAVRSCLLQGREFGGDFLDFFWLDATERRLAVVVGSVDGQGLPAAFLTISARALVRALAAGSASPGACLGQVSDLLVGENGSNLALYMTLAVLDVPANIMVVARAGLPPPIAAARPGDVRLLSVEGAPPLALRPGTRVPDTTVDVPERTLLMLFSQGLTTVEMDGMPLGTDGVRALVAQAQDLDVEPATAFLSDRLAAARCRVRGDASFVALRLHG